MSGRSDSSLRRFANTQYGNAERLAHHFGRDIRYCSEWKTWLVWDGARWKKTDTSRINQFAYQTVRRILGEIPPRKQQPTDTERQFDQSIARWAFRSENRHELESMVALAQSLPEVLVTPNDFDQNRMLLNVRNGTLNLRTGQLSPHRREDLITRVAPVNFRPHAVCPTWLKFLNRIFNEETALIAFIQRVIGYTLTGDVSEKVLFIPHGSGNNGKTTLVETIRGLLGDDYAGVMNIEVLTTEGSSSDRLHAIAELFGKRFITASESEQGEALREAMVKNLTGMGRLKGRHMYSSAFEFDPTFKLFIDANHLPQIRGSDPAIWDRIRRIPFNVSIPKEERDKKLIQKLRAELPGILTWAVEGCLGWQSQGLRTPTAVETAVEEYRE